MEIRLLVNFGMALGRLNLYFIIQFEAFITIKDEALANPWYEL